MHIKIIGSNMNKFYDELKKSTFLRNIINYWDIDNLETLNYENLQCYFNYLKEINLKDEEKFENNAINLKEVLILKVNNIFDPEVNVLIEEIDQLSQTYCMPLVLLLTVNNSDQKLVIDTDKYDYIDPRLFFVAKYTEKPKELEKEIFPLLLRLCSIHNELGDVFCVGKDNKGESFDLTETSFPFNLNIACVGRFGQGKSTGVNALLKEYKAKESNKGSSQTKNLTYYQVKNHPIRVLDIPGFENEQTVQDAIEKFKFCGEEINRMKEKIHIILYFLNYSEKRAFMKLEYPLIEEITKHKATKIIYVITHSKSNITEKIKNIIIKRINSGIKGITKNPEQIEKFKADTNNIIFVNFRKNILIQEEPFGIKELFKKIYDVFIQSEDYKNSLEQLTKENIEKKALQLRAEAQSILFSNKMWGAAVGAIPLVDMILQHFVIKKNAVKKVGEIFGIDVTFIDEENDKKKVESKNGANASYIHEIDGEKELEESTGNKVLNGIKCFEGIGTYSSGAYSLAEASTMSIKAADLAVKATELGAKATQLTAKTADLTAKAAQLATEAATETKNMNFLVKFVYSFTKTTTALSKAATTTGVQAATVAQEANSASISAASLAQKAASASSSVSLSRLTGIGLLGIGVVIGIGFGGYFTHKFCEELLDKFVDYYKKNADKLANSYKNAADYFNEYEN
jgi:GTP-binding protein EngB required for normal cell division